MNINAEKKRLILQPDFIEQIHAILQMGVFRRSRGRYPENIFLEASSQAPIFQHNGYGFPRDLINHLRSATCKGLPTLNWTSTSIWIIQLSKGLHFQEKSDIDQVFFIDRNRWLSYVRPFQT